MRSNKILIKLMMLLNKILIKIITKIIMQLNKILIKTSINYRCKILQSQYMINLKLLVLINALIWIKKNKEIAAAYFLINEFIW